jgi:hypothetical protein
MVVGPAVVPAIAALVINVAAVARNAAVTTAARHHDRKPCAVSRKNTSSLWIRVHRARKRPARYPPIPEAITCITISQRIAPAPMVAADAP